MFNESIYMNLKAHFLVILVKKLLKALLKVYSPFGSDFRKYF